MNKLILTNQIAMQIEKEYQAYMYTLAEKNNKDIINLSTKTVFYEEVYQFSKDLEKLNYLHQTTLVNIMNDTTEIVENMWYRFLKQDGFSINQEDILDLINEY